MCFHLPVFIIQGQSASLMGSRESPSHAHITKDLDLRSGIAFHLTFYLVCVIFQITTLWDTYESWFAKIFLATKLLYAFVFSCLTPEDTGISDLPVNKFTIIVPTHGSFVHRLNCKFHENGRHTCFIHHWMASIVQYLAHDEN